MVTVRKTLIIIVDDNKNDRMLLGDLLASMNYDVMEAKNGIEALESIGTSKPDLIISDIMMPGMDGFTFLRELKKSESYVDIPFVFYTAHYLNNKDCELASKLGASRFIKKPANLYDLLKEIEAVLKEYEAGLIKPAQPLIDKEEDYLRQYSECVVNKLEEKIVQLEAEINERRWAFEELANAQNEHEHIVESIPFIIYALNVDGNLIRWNSRLIEATGVMGAEIMGKPILDFVVEKDRKKMAEAIKTARETGYSRVDAHLLCENNGQLQFRWDSASLKDESGSVIGLSCVGINITESGNGKRSENRNKHIMKTVKR